jgi:hypothetical protein
VLDLIKQMYSKAPTVVDISIAKNQRARILQAIAASYSLQSRTGRSASRYWKKSANDLNLLYKRQEPLRQ